MWRSVSIVQKKTDLILEDLEQDENKEAKQEEKEVRLTQSQPLGNIQNHFQKDRDLLFYSLKHANGSMFISISC